MKSDHRFILIPALAAVALMAILAWLTPIAFSGYRTSDKSARFWLWLSHSAGHVSTPIILAITGVLLAAHRERFRERLLAFFSFFVPVALIIGVVAYANEHLVKPLTRMPRPSHRYLEQKGVVELPLLYEKDKEQRQEYLAQKIKQHEDKVEEVYPPLLEHWIYEAEYSFPSGHTLNAFLVAVLLAYLIRRRGAKICLFSLPLAWSLLVGLSRVAIGVHTPLDISGGALLGVLLAYSGIGTGLLDRVVSLDS